MKNNHLTVTITGTYVDDDGAQHEIHSAYEDLDFIYIHGFKDMEDKFERDTGVIGMSCFQYWTNILEDIIQERVGPEIFPGLAEIALEHLKKEDKTT